MNEKQSCTPRCRSFFLTKRSAITGQRVGLVCNQASVMPDTFCTCGRRFSRTRGIQAHDTFRPAARYSRRRAVQHDRDAARPRRADRHDGLFALQRGPRTDRGNARGPRHYRRRPAGRRLPHLHLHLHDGELHACRRKIRQAGRRLRPAKPDRRQRGRGQCHRRGIHVIRRPVRAADAARNDDRRAGEDVQRAFRHRLRTRGRRDGRLDTRDVGRRDRPAVGAAVAKYSRLSTRAWSFPRPCTSKAPN